MSWILLVPYFISQDMLCYPHHSTFWSNPSSTLTTLNPHQYLFLIMLTKPQYPITDLLEFPYLKWRTFHEWRHFLQDDTISNRRILLTLFQMIYHELTEPGESRHQRSITVYVPYYFINGIKRFCMIADELTYNATAESHHKCSVEHLFINGIARFLGYQGFNGRYKIKYHALCGLMLQMRKYGSAANFHGGPGEEHHKEACHYRNGCDKSMNCTFLICKCSFDELDDIFVHHFNYLDGSQYNLSD